MEISPEGGMSSVDGNRQKYTIVEAAFPPAGGEATTRAAWKWYVVCAALKGLAGSQVSEIRDKELMRPAPTTSRAEICEIPLRVESLPRL